MGALAAWQDRPPGLAAAAGVLLAVLAAAAGGVVAGSVVAAVGFTLFVVLVADAAPWASLSAPGWLLAAAAAGLIADRLRATERERQRLARRLDAISESVPDAIVRVDDERIIVGWSRGARRLYGYEAEEATGRPLSLLVPEDRPQELEHLIERLEGGAGADGLEGIHRHRDGGAIRVSLVAVPLTGADGERSGGIVVARDSAEHARLAERARDADSRRRALFDRLPVIAYVHPVGERGSVAEISPQAETLLGYAADEWAAEQGLFSRLLHPDDRERVVAELAAAAATGEPFQSEYRLLSRDGRVVWIRDEATTVRDARGEPQYVQGFMLDLTERKEAELERADLLAGKRQAVDQSVRVRRMLDLITGAGGVAASVSDSDKVLRRIAEVIVRELADWCLVDLLEEDGTLRRRDAAHGQAGRSGPRGAEPGSEPELEVVRALETSRTEVGSQLAAISGEDGSLAALGFASWVCAPMRARGRTLGVLTLLSAEPDRAYGPDDVVLAEDIARRTALALDNARLLREVEERSDAARVLEWVGDGVCLLDRSGVIRLWNPAAEAITGLAVSAVVGRAAAEVLPGWPDVVERIPVASSPEPIHAETVPLETPLGERWLSISGVEFFGGTVYAFRDLTEERRLDELKAEFVATASHELRTPLAAVYGAAQTLRRHDFALDEAGRERFVSLIVDESERLSRVVNEILLANQLDAGRFHLETEPFAPVEFAERAVESVRAHAPPGISLEVSAPEVVPPIAADRDKVRQVLVNLLENAIKYSPDGGRIEVGVQPHEDAVCFSVRDEGLGIPYDEQARIFEKFYRLDPDLTRGVGGTGLGLYISSELVSRMGGRIWVESVPGRGSTFFFDLPLAEAALRGVAAPAHETSSAGGSA